MLYQLLKADLFIGTAGISICVASLIILALAIEVARNSGESRKEQNELFSYLRVTQPLFQEFYATHKNQETAFTASSH